MEDWLLFLVALCFSELVHNALEIWGIVQKVEWLRLSLANQKHGTWPININTKLKTIILHVLILLLSGGAGFVILKILNLSREGLVLVGITILLINYVVTTWKVDKFHEEIGKLIKKAKEN